jgi:hypothetical protein
MPQSDPRWDVAPQHYWPGQGQNPMIYTPRIRALDEPPRRPQPDLRRPPQPRQRQPEDVEDDVPAVNNRAEPV